MKYTGINMMVPTRGRVLNGRLPKFVSSALSLAADPSRIFFTFVIDPGDNESSRYATRLARSRAQVDIIVSDWEQPHLAKSWNAAFERTSFTDPGILASMVGDDMAWETPGYDARILDAMNERGGRAIVYCDDGFVQHEKLCVNMFVARDLVTATGRPFMCERFRANIIDSIWMDVGRRCGLLCYLPDVILRHEHKFTDENRSALSRFYTYDKSHRKFIDAYSYDIAETLKMKGCCNG